MSIIVQLEQFMVEQKYIKEAGEISATDSLLEHGIIDSVGIQQLVVFLEEKYGITVDEDDLMPENFDTLEAIDSYVRSKSN